MVFGPSSIVSVISAIIWCVVKEKAKWPSWAFRCLEHGVDLHPTYES